MQECRSSMYLNTQGKNKGFFSALFWSNRNVVRVVMMLKFLKLLWWEESLTLLNPNIVLWGRLQNTITHAQALSPREFTSYTSSTKAVTICTLGTKTDGSKSKDQKDKQNQIKEVVSTSLPVFAVPFGYYSYFVTCFVELKTVLEVEGSLRSVCLWTKTTVQRYQ